MEFTGERFIPGKGGAQIAYEHLLRYLYAREAAAGKRVLDLGAGEGYGAFLLAQVARGVVAIEIDGQTVSYAASKYAAPNLSFVQGSILAAPFTDAAAFDVVTCFEVIEHVSEPEQVVREARRLLHPSGLFFVSTPNKRVYSDESRTANPFHVREFYLDEFRTLLERHFRHVLLYGQRLAYGAALWELPPGAGSGTADYVLRVEPAGAAPFREAGVWQDPMYFVAVCSDDPVPATLTYRSIYLNDQARLVQAEMEAAGAAAHAAVRALEDDRAALRESLAEIEAARREREAHTAAIEATSAGLTAQRDRLQADLRDLKVDRDGWRRRAAVFQLSVERAERTIADLQAVRRELESKVAALDAERVAASAQAEALSHSNSDLRTQVQSLGADRDAWQRQAEAHRQSHVETAQVLREIQESIAWKLVLRYRIRLDRLLPPGTLRRRAYRRLLISAADSYRMAVLNREGLRGLLRRLAVHLGGAGVALLKEMRVRLDPRLRPRAMEVEVIGVRPPVRRHTETVEIIVSVHDALEDVQACLEAVRVNTTPPYTLVLVDDGSGPDTREFLRGFADRHRAVLLRNEAARGYTRAANQALARSGAEFAVLLNSDTIVTRGWLDRLLACARSDARIGLVGPLSNTASWQSIPEIESDGDWAPNPLPDGVAVADMGRLVAERSARLYPSMPFLNGFCLLVRRQVRLQIGDFDEQAFGDGYGEENDYCLRARKAGWKLALADDTYVFHAQSRSYSNDARRRLGERAMTTLVRKHGQHAIDQGVEYCRRHRVLEGIRARSRVMIPRDAATAEARARFAGKRVLFLLPIGTPGGGGNVVITEARAMRTMGVGVSLFNLAGNRDAFEAGYPDLALPLLYGDPEDVLTLSGHFDAIVATAWQSVDWLRPVAAAGEGKVLGYYIQDFEPYFYQHDVDEYRKALASYSSVPGIVPFTKTVWTQQELLGQTGVPSTVVGVGVDTDLFRPRPRTVPEWPQGPLGISAMIRPESAYRAPHLTMEILRRAARHYGSRVKIVLFGTEMTNPGFLATPHDFPWSLAGVLNRNQVASMLNAIDVFVDYSTHQAMGLTALEAMACGAAVVAPERGGTPSFIRQGESGLLVDTSSAQACWEALTRVIEDHDLRTRIQRRALADACACYPERPASNILAALFDRDRPSR